MYTHESLYTYLPLFIWKYGQQHETLESHGSVNENLWILKGLLLLLLLLLLLTVSRVEHKFETLRLDVFNQRYGRLVGDVKHVKI